jgi:membrane peptidoglycan carboxypeptidase
MPLDGRMSAELAIRFDLEQPAGEGVVLDASIVNGCVALDEPPGADVRTLTGVIDHRFPGGPTSPVGPGVGDWTPLQSVPAYVDGAFVAAEDARFHDHDGFDTAQIARSLEVDLREGRFARGGSTISQQLIKNAFLDHRRSLARKLQEAVLTWRLEEHLGKRQILERYLNVIELGPNVFGIAAAARYWFGKSPASLSIREAAFLAAMTPEPRTMSRRISAAGGLDAQSHDRVETVLRHMARGGWISEEEQSDARRAGLSLRRAALTATGT